MGSTVNSVKTGLPLTDLNARTGEFTPPGIYFFASLKSFSFVEMFM